MEIEDQYIEEVKHKVIVCEENGKQARFLNGNQCTIQRIHVDGCVIPKGEIACDYLVRHIAEEPYAEYFVELKGTDVKHAIEQLEASIKQLGEKQASIRYAIVVSSKVAPATGTDVQIGQKRLLKRFGFNLLVRSRQYEHDLDKDLG